jgi:hypothetical protein
MICRSDVILSETSEVHSNAEEGIEVDECRGDSGKLTNTTEPKELKRSSCVFILIKII